jgi:hypothetical protein
MNAEKSDWRLMGQEKYLKGATLCWSTYKKRSEEWDHDHCAFCQEKFMESGTPDTLHQGYATAGEYHWVCKKCFEDFKTSFGWHIDDRRPESGLSGKIKKFKAWLDEPVSDSKSTNTTQYILVLAVVVMLAVKFKSCVPNWTHNQHSLDVSGPDR